MFAVARTVRIRRHADAGVEKNFMRICMQNRGIRERKSPSDKRTFIASGIAEVLTFA